MVGRTRKSSSFFTSEVLERLREEEPDEAYLAAAQRVLVDSLGLSRDERALVVFEEEHASFAAALVRVGAEHGKSVDAVRVEAGSPEDMLKDRLARRVESCDVSLMLAAFSFPRPIREQLTKIDNGRRHAHLLGISDAVIRQSLRVDYRDVDALGRRLVDALAGASTVHVESAGGTRLVARLGRATRWYNQGGILHEPGWTNLPAGEVVACPVDVEGVFVPDGGVWLTDGTPLDRAASRRLALHFQGGILVRSEGPEDARTRLLEHIDAGREGRRVGQLAFGTNVGVIAPIGVGSQDVKLPSLHLVLGYSAPELTGARWNGDVLVQLLQRSATVNVDGREILSKGRYAADLAGG